MFAYYNNTFSNNIKILKALSYQHEGQGFDPKKHITDKMYIS